MTNREVDLVLERGDGRIVGIEVKAPLRKWKARDFAGLHALAEEAGKQFLSGLVLHGAEMAAVFDPICRQLR